MSKKLKASKVLRLTPDADLDEYVASALTATEKAVIARMRALKIIKPGQKAGAHHFKELAEAEVSYANATAAINQSNDVAIILANRSRVLAGLELRLSDPKLKDSAYASLANLWFKISSAPLTRTFEAEPPETVDDLTDDELEAIRKQIQRGAA
ncbi:hypothetical protein [Buttiauxella sp.]|uniref:hypothetical protein n=1 Tax=Buttiauxella sp. TaxID=1972222 RepID=UPI003C78BA6A